MVASLDGCWAKLDRAKEQIDVLNQELREYVESKPYGISDEPEHWPGDRFVWRFRDVTEPPIRFGVMFGEIVHNLRSTLDHLIYQLVRLNRKKPYPGNSFPVHDLRLPDPLTAKRGCWVCQAPSQLQGVRKDHRAVVEAVQPYKRRHRASHHPLRVLTELWNIDKHRIVHAVALSAPADLLPSNVTVDFGGFAGVNAEIIVQPGTLKDGAVALSLQFLAVPYGTPPHVDVKGEFPVRVVFGDRGTSTMNLHRIGGFIANRILNEAADLFPNESRRDHPLMHQIPQLYDFPQVRPGEGIVYVPKSSESPKRFGDWEAWYEGSTVALQPDGTLAQILPHWALRDGEGNEYRIPARRTTLEQLGVAVGGLLPPDLMAEYFEYFQPVPREMGGEVWLMPL